MRMAKYPRMGITTMKIEFFNDTGRPLKVRTVGNITLYPEISTIPIAHNILFKLPNGTVPFIKVWEDTVLCAYSIDEENDDGERHKHGRTAN